MESFLTVVAEVVAKRGKESEVREQLLALIEPTRNEAGCIQYDLHESEDQPGRFVFYENWSCQEALDRHLKSPHFERIAPVVTGMVSEPVSIRKFRRIG